ncbi:MAG: HAMP domain-containing histidine kinase [Clostridiales bacterium]|nr:HAMP domain-containing histidine kinase [Clostridiales bacterium]
MQWWLWVIIAVLVLIIVVILYQFYFVCKSAREIKQGLASKLATDTNTLLDISSRDRSMRELADSLNVELIELRDRRHRYEQGDRQLKQAVTNIAHDIRTPLTAICAYLDLLEGEEQSGDAKRYLEVIGKRTEDLKRLTEELFRYSVFMAESADATYQPLSLSGALEESVSAYYPALMGCGIVPEITMPEQAVTRQLNKNALTRILENIIGNAIKYSDGDLQITLHEDGEMVFSNSAAKLDEIQVGKLFDRFYTVDAATKSTGLGLTIAKTLTEQMNGKIHADYSDGRLSIHLKFE